jgi:hypothetical protein
MELNFKCEYCGKKFAKEKTLVVHVCEQKRRHLGKNEKHVQAALLTYNRFYELAQGGKGNKTFTEFAKSPYYNAFVKFGSWIANINPLYPNQFIDYVVKSGVKLDHWCRDALYDTYLLDLIKKEPADGAIQRTIQTMMDWADNNNAPWEHYFKYVGLNRATHDIKEGLISPWILLNTKAGKELLQKMNDEQLDIVGSMIDPRHWARRFKQVPADIELVKEVIKEAKIL